MMDKERASNEQAAAGTVRGLSKLKPTKGERFLDIGANVCFVSNWAAEQGCTVLAYEPMEISNARSMPHPAVQLRRKAVTADGRTVKMRIAQEAVERGYTCSAKIFRNSGKDILQYEGIESDPVAQVLAEFEPNIVKIDVEGSEYEILPAGDFSNARAMFIEFHGCAGRPEAVIFPLILKRLFNQGFIPDAGWPKNIRFDERDNFRRLIGVGFWREILFVKGSRMPPELDAVLVGAKAILDGGKWAGPNGRMSDEAFQQLANETV